MGRRREHFVLVPVGVLALAATGLSGCSDTTDTGTFVAAPEPAATVELTPAEGEQDAPLSTELGITVTGGEITTVDLRDADGETVSGDFRPDASAWVPDAPLKPATTYSAEVEAVDENGIPTLAHTSFSTMKAPGERVTASLWNNADYSYGNAMPLMIDFPEGFEVGEKYRAGVEKRLFVSSEPPQEGAWHWFTGNHIEYRPQEFWEPGTVITVRAALDGVPLGGGKYGEKDIQQTVTIDQNTRVIEISNADKEMVAKENGEVVKTMPISLGKSSTPSYSGTMTIMEQLEHTVFDTTAECGGRVMGDNCYRTPVDWAQRLTWSGQFIHSAPWSVGDQGVRNVSHGCVNASPSDSKWVFDFAKVGDAVVVEGTEWDLPYGDGFTAFDMSWDDFLAGSYLHQLEESGAADSEAGDDAD